VNTRHATSLLKVEIEIELLLFKDCIRSVERAERAGHLNKDDAHRLRNGLARVYAERIEIVVDERRP
jgi:hypothetical protein